MDAPSQIEARLAALEAKVQKLDDIEAIRTLRWRYHDCINRGKGSEAAALFADDADLDYAHLKHARGRAEIDAYLTNLHSSSVKQFIHNMVVEVNGNHAVGFSYLWATPVYKGESFVVATRFDDEYEKIGGKWFFKKVKMTPYYMVPLREGWAQEHLIKLGI